MDQRRHASLNVQPNGPPPPGRPIRCQVRLYEGPPAQDDPRQNELRCVGAEPVVVTMSPHSAAAPGSLMNAEPSSHEFACSAPVTVTHVAVFQDDDVRIAHARLPKFCEMPDGVGRLTFPSGWLTIRYPHLPQFVGGR